MRTITVFIFSTRGRKDVSRVYGTVAELWNIILKLRDVLFHVSLKTVFRGKKIVTFDI